MCLGVPGKVVETAREDGVLMGRVDFGGVSKRVCLEHVGELEPGSWVLVHVGFAIARIDEDEARRIFDLLAELGELAELQPEERAGDMVPEGFRAPKGQA